MARFDIIDAKTGSVKYSGAPRYNGTYCKVSYLEFSEICSDSLISWNIGDYIVYPRTGLTYRLFDIPQPKKRSYRSEYGGAYVYSNVQFFADTKWLEIEPFRDIVPADNKIHFTTQSSWSVWTNVEGLIARLNAVMQAAHPDEWEFRLVNASEDSELYKLLHDEYLDFTVSGESVLGGLGKIYDSFGNIGWVHSVEDGKNIITVGIPPIYQDIGDFTEVYRYGAGRGLTEIRKSVTNKNELKTRLYAYGSTRNMIPRYYNELTPAIKDADSVNIPNLMLPLSKWGMTNGKRDASKAFVERNVGKYGLRPDTVYFDGSDGNKEIYPSIEDTTIGDLYDAMADGEAYRPDLAKHNRSIRLDAVESVRGIVDDGIESDSGAKYVDTILIPVAANSGDYKENFEISLFSGVQAPMSGKVTIPLSGITIIGTSESAPYYLSYRATITVAGRSYVTDIYNPELAASIKFSLEDVEVECSEGDEISATLSCVRDNSAPATHIEINQVTLAAGIASKKDNSIVITIPQIGFDISTRAALGSQGIATISMKDGMCGGRSFVVKSCAYFESTDSWELTLYRGRDESLGMLFPNTTYPISAGDHFVLLDIAMPDTYIGMAEQRLLTAANELLDSVSEQKPFYELSVDAKYMIENNLTLLEGRYMRLSDTDMISDVEYLLIDTVVINESESSIPTYRVTLREQKRVSYSNSQSSGDSLTSLASGGGLIESGLTPKQKKILSCFDIDDEGDIYTKSDENGRPRGFYTNSFITAGGKGESSSGGGSADYTQWGWDDIIQLTSDPGLGNLASAWALKQEYDSRQSALSILSQGIDSIRLLIPSSASESNQLADKEFVNSSIASNTATFRGTFEGVSYLPSGAKLNDYAFVIATDASGNPEYNRYKYTASGWAFEYTLNNSSFTAEQWSAITSGITANLVSLYSEHIANQSNPHAVTKSQIGLGDVENIKLSSWEGSTSITTLGAVTTGEWKASKIANDYLVSSTIQIGSTTVSLGGAIEALSGIESISLKGNNDAKLTYDNGAWHLSGNLLVDGYITAGGVGSSSGGGGIDSAAMWALLGDATNEQINKTHISAALEGYQSIIPDLATIRSNATNGNTAYGWGNHSGLYLPLTGGTMSNTNVVTNLNADLLDGLHKSHLFVTNFSTIQSSELDTYATRQSGTYTVQYPGYTKTLVTFRSIGSASALELLYEWDNSNLLCRTAVDSNRFTAWKQIAFTDSNVASASKWATPRTITLTGSVTGSVSIDGSGDVTLATTTNHTHSQYLTGITSLMVTSALGYTPYNASNPNGYISGISKAMVENVLTGNITSHTHSFLVNDSGNLSSRFLFHSSNGIPGEVGNMDAYGAWGHPANSQDSYYGNAYIARLKWSDYYYSDIFTGPTDAGSTYGLQWRQIVNSKATNWRILLDTANFNTYAPTLTGGGASGTWGISITGNAASATQLQTSRTIWGQSFDGTGNVSGTLKMGTCDIEPYTHGLKLYGYYTSLQLQSANIYNTQIEFLDVDGLLRWSFSYRGLNQANKDFFIFRSIDGTNVDTVMSFINSNGNVGIGTTSPSEKLHVAGNILASGAITAGTASDSRLKSNIATLVNASSVLRQLRGVGFEWNALATDKSSYFRGHDVGLIAQEVEPLIPSAIGTIWGDYKRLDYAKITPYLVEGWKEHDTEINRLRARVTELESEVNKLRQYVN